MKTLLGLTALVLLPALATAGGYGYQTYYQPYYQPYYVKYPVAVYEPVKVVAYTASYVEPAQTQERVIEKTTTTTKEVVATEAVTQQATTGQQVRQAVVQQQAVTGNTNHCPDVLALANELRLLREEVAKLKGGQSEPLPQPGPAPAGTLTQQKCGACHQAKHANAKGAGLVLTEDDGRLATLSLPYKGSALRRVDNGTMPPPKDKDGNPLAPLTDAEKQAVKAELAPN